MDHAFAMRIRERVSELAHQADGIAEGQRPFAPEPLPQRLALHEGHREVRQPLDVPGAEERHHVGVLEPGGEPDLALEALGREAGGELGGQHLHHDPACQPRIRSEEDARHAAAAELALEGVGAAQRRLQLLAQLGAHEDPPEVSGANIRRRSRARQCDAHAMLAPRRARARLRPSTQRRTSQGPATSHGPSEQDGWSETAENPCLSATTGARHARRDVSS
jgi:hypothetical protein